MLYDQDVLEEWISREVEPCEDEGYQNIQTGELLNQEEVENYERCRHRLCESHGVGEQADRLVRIVDRCMPKIADENRA